MAYIVITNDGDILGVAENKKIAINAMIKYLKDCYKRYHWFDSDEEVTEYITQVKDELQADGFIYAIKADFWYE